MQCLVMILEMFPETGAVEIICPVKEANLLAERKKYPKWYPTNQASGKVSTLTYPR